MLPSLTQDGDGAVLARPTAPTGLHAPVAKCLPSLHPLCSSSKGRDTNTNPKSQISINGTNPKRLPVQLMTRGSLNPWREGAKFRQTESLSPSKLL